MLAKRALLFHICRSLLIAAAFVSNLTGADDFKRAVWALQMVTRVPTAQYVRVYVVLF